VVRQAEQIGELKRQLQLVLVALNRKDPITYPLMPRSIARLPGCGGLD
jgi:hypothetical protein